MHGRAAQIVARPATQQYNEPATAATASSRHRDCQCPRRLRHATRAQPHPSRELRLRDDERRVRARLGLAGVVGGRGVCCADVDGTGGSQARCVQGRGGRATRTAALTLTAGCGSRRLRCLARAWAQTEPEVSWPEWKLGGIDTRECEMEDASITIC
jgi:hypothetical protein